ncbi:MAG: hypothetical protein ACO3A4_05610 [Silvanigrellaceae bacterium]
MWFVWDGRTRTGPFSELEICRRVASGQWPLTLLVRPEQSSVFRPLVWMLPEWTEEKNESEKTIVRELAPMHESTQIASPMYIEKAVTPLLSGGTRPNAQAAPIPPPPPPEPPLPPSPPPPVMNAKALQPETDSNEVQFGPRTGFRGNSQSLSFEKPKIPSDGDFDFLTTELAGAKRSRDDVKRERLNTEQIESGELVQVAPFSLTPSAPVSLKPEKKNEFSSKTSNSVIRAAAAAIQEGERETQEFEKRKLPGVNAKKDEVVLDSESAEPLGVGARKVGKHDAVQSPAKVSEGSVSLVDHTSATQIKFRRVNPTAPRRRGKGSGSRSKQKFGLVDIGRLLNGQIGSGAQAWNLRTLAVAFLGMILVVGTAAFFYYKKKNAPIETSTAEVSEPSAPVLESTVPPKRKKKQKPERAEGVEPGTKKVAAIPNVVPTQAPQFNKSPPETGGKKKSNLKARPLPNNQVDLPKLTAPAFRNDIFVTGADLKRYLAKAGPKSFVVVGPITLQDRPAKKCAPCRGSGFLSDGTTITLSSFVAMPWKKVARSNVVYVKGILTSSGSLTLMINAIDNKPF